MNYSKDYQKINRDSWNKRTPHHIASEFYDNNAFIAGKTSLNNIELDLIGDVTDLTVLHLQCHFGQDTISFSRMGAHATGVDLSDVAIAEAKKLAGQIGTNTDFIVSDILELDQNHDKQYDLVFTSYGTIGWLPDINRWGDIVNKFLKPGGRFIIVEFHPVVWMFDDDLKEVFYKYSQSDAIQEKIDGTYAEKDANIEGESICWNHGLADVIQALLRQDLELADFKEYDYSPYDCLANMEKIGERKYQVKHWGDKVPLVYSLVFNKKL